MVAKKQVEPLTYLSRVRYQPDQCTHPEVRRQPELLAMRQEGHLKNLPRGRQITRTASFSSAILESLTSAMSFWTLLTEIVKLYSEGNISNTLQLFFVFSEDWNVP